MRASSFSRFLIIVCSFLLDLLTWHEFGRLIAKGFWATAIGILPSGIPTAIGTLRVFDYLKGRGIREEIGMHSYPYLAS